MKKIFLLIVVPALLVALGFAQTPAPSSNTDQVNVKGCLGGSDGNYTVAEDNTGKIFKITTSSTDLKAYVGQDVNLVGNKADASENSLAVTGLNMISEHCAAAAAAPAAAASAATAPVASVSTPSQTVDATAAAPAAAAPAPTASAPAEAVSAPPSAAAPADEPAPIVSLPPAAAAPDAAAPVSAAPQAAAPSETVSAPAPADATMSTPAKTAEVHRTRPSARARKAEETPAETPAAAAAPAEPVTSTPAAIAPAVGPPPATASTPAAPATKASASRSAGMLVGIVVVLLLVGAGVPLYNRWRKRKLLEQTKGQNLSFTNEAKPTNEAKSDPGKSDTTGGRKAA
jgi:hypothetical protein